MRVATYTRATDSSDGRAMLQRRQRRLDAYLATRSGWNLAARYADLGGSNRPRPGLQKLFVDAAGSLFDLVLADDLGRFAHGAGAAQSIVSSLQANGVIVELLPPRPKSRRLVAANAWVLADTLGGLA
jgi:hypothetical protein